MNIYKKYKFEILVNITLLLIGFFLYWNSLSGAFFWDENNFIIHNLSIRHWTNIPDIFSHTIAYGSSVFFNYYRPLQEFTYLIDYSFWELNPWGYHLTNIILHILVSTSVYYFVKLLTQNKHLSFFVSLLFISHPVHVESVACVSARGELVCALFVLLTCYFYIKHEQKISFFQIITIFFCCFFALLSKENSVILCLLLPAYHLIYKKKIHLFKATSIIASFALYVLIRLSILSSTGEGFLSKIDGIGQRLPGVFEAFIHYCYLLLFPNSLHFDYGQPIFTYTDPRVIAGIILFIISIYIFLKARTSHPIISFSIAWFMIALLPYSNLYPIFSYMSEHSLYISSIGFFIIIALLINHWTPLNIFQRPTQIIIFCICLIFGFLTIQQNTYWSDPIYFYKRTIHFNPESYSSYTNLGNIYGHTNDFDQEIACHKKALEIKPNSSDALFNLASTYLDMNEFDKAIPLFKKIISLNPYNHRALESLGIIYAKTGERESAEKYFLEALSINKKYLSIHLNLAVFYIDNQQFSMAKKYLLDYLKLSNKNEQAYLYLGLVEYKENNLIEAYSAFEKALRLNPNSQPAYFHLALIEKLQDANSVIWTKTLKKGFTDLTSYENARKEILTIISSIEINQTH